METDAVNPSIMHEFVSLLNDEVRNALSERDCLRFLRARKLDAQKAATMANNWWIWWKTPIPGTKNVCPSEILDCVEDENEHIYKRLMPHSNCCYDKQGHPIYWEQTGLISSRFADVSKELSVDELVARHIRQQELMMHRLRYISHTLQRPIEKQVIVFNLKHLSYSLDPNALSAFRRTLQIDQDYYPERLHHFVMINAPWFFTAMWSMIKPWIDPVTAEKFKILGSDYLPALRDIIDNEQIPAELGGGYADFPWCWPYPESSGMSPSQLYAAKAHGDVPLEYLLKF